MALADELVKEVVARWPRVDDYTTLVALPTAQTEIGSHLSNVRSARGEAVSTKAMLDALCTATALAKKGAQVRADIDVTRGEE